VYAGKDPLTGREIRFRKTRRTEVEGLIELGRLLELARAGRNPDSGITVAELLDAYVPVAEWEVSTEEANLGCIRRTIKPALGTREVRKVRGPLLDNLYARLQKCGDLACAGKPFTEHPIDALPPLTDPPPDQIDLFAASAPRKPPNPPPPVTIVRWQSAAPVSHSGNVFGDSGTDTINPGQQVPPGCVLLGVKLQLLDRHGVPLGDIGTTTTTGRPDATTGGWPFNAGARILSDATGGTDETVTVHWWYDFGHACRYQICYLIQFPSPQRTQHASLPWLCLLLP
jgi:hypothetical protein